MDCDEIFVKISRLNISDINLDYLTDQSSGVIISHFNGKTLLVENINVSSLVFISVRKSTGLVVGKITSLISGVFSNVLSLDLGGL